MIMTYEITIFIFLVFIWGMTFLIDVDKKERKEYIINDILFTVIFLLTIIIVRFNN